MVFQSLQLNIQRSFYRSQITSVAPLVMGHFFVQPMNWTNQSLERAALHTLPVEIQHCESKLPLQPPTNDHGSTIYLIFSNIPSDRSPEHGV